MQGGLEIPCRVEIQIPPTLKNRETISYDTREKDCGWIVPFDLFQEYPCSM